MGLLRNPPGVADYVTTAVYGSKRPVWPWTL